MKCQAETEEVKCPPPSYRGPAGWFCDHHWEHTQQTVDRVKGKIRRLRNPKDTL